MNRSFTGAVIRFFATGFYISYLAGFLFGFLKFKKNTGAGLFGTILAVPLCLLLPRGNTEYFVFLLFFCAFAVFISGKAAFGAEAVKDNPKIVIDEIAGYFAAMFLSAPVWQNLLAAFILFRIFDTIKPFGIKKLDSVKGGLGIVADDLGAGFYSFLIMQALKYAGLLP